MNCILIHLQRELSCLSQSVSPHSITIINAASKNTKTTCLPLLLVDSKGYTIIDEPPRKSGKLGKQKKKKKKKCFGPGLKPTNMQNSFN